MYQKVSYTGPQVQMTLLVPERGAPPDAERAHRVVRVQPEAPFRPGNALAVAVSQPGLSTSAVP